MTTDQRPPEYLRADAARNVHRIVEVAARLLGDDPHVGMAAVAAAADVSRATVYRHFPTREALIDAIRTQAVEARRAGARRVPAGRGQRHRGAAPPRRRLAGRRRALRLPAARRPGRSPTLRRGARAPAPRLRRAADRARSSAARPPASSPPRSTPEWGVRVFGALLLAGARAVDDGALSRADAPDTVFHTLLEGLRA